jgi:hypothetical protein
MVGFAAAMAVRDKLSRPKRSLRLRYGPVCTQRQLLRWNRNVGRTTSEAGDGKERRVLGTLVKQQEARLRRWSSCVFCTLKFSMLQDLEY